MESRNLHCEFEKRTSNKRFFSLTTGAPLHTAFASVDALCVTKQGLMECSAVRLRRLMGMGLLPRRIKPLSNELLGPVKLGSPGVATTDVALKEYPAAIESTTCQRAIPSGSFIAPSLSWICDPLGCIYSPYLRELCTLSMCAPRP